MKTLLLLLSSLLFTSCQNSPKPSHSNILRLTTNRKDITLNSKDDTCCVSTNIQSFIFEGLASFSSNHQSTLALAEKLSVSSDQKTYTFHLRNAKWSNGDPITSYDFKASWKTLLNPSSLSIKTPDSKTLIISFKNPNPHFLEIAAHTLFFPIHPKNSEKTETYLPITNGPFKVQKWLPNAILILEKNPFYWDAKNVHLDEVHILFIDHEMTAFQMFEKGEIDFIGGVFGRVPTDARRTLLKEKKLKIAPTAMSSYHIFNRNRFPFNHKKLRQAFSYAINRKELMENITDIKQEIATSFMPSCLKENHYDLFFEDGNRQKARTLFKEALDELKINPTFFNRVKITHISGSSESQMAQAVQDQWRKAFGIHIKLFPADIKTAYAYRKSRNFDILQWSLDAPVDSPMNFLSAFKSLGFVNTYPSSDLDQLLNELNEEPCKEKRLSLLHTMEEFFAEEMPAAPLFHCYTPYIHQDYVQGIEISPRGGFVNVKNISIDHSKKGKL